MKFKVTYTFVETIEMENQKQAMDECWKWAKELAKAELIAIQKIVVDKVR